MIRLPACGGSMYLPCRRVRGIRVLEKKPRSWAVTLIKNRGMFLGYVDAPDQKAAEIAAAKAFMLTEWQRKRLLVRERL